MNRQRRAVLNAVLDELKRLRNSIQKDEAIAILKKAQSDVEMCADEEQDALDNRPETFQFSASNDDMEANVSDLCDAGDTLSDLVVICNESETYDYDAIKKYMADIVNNIKQAIHR